MNSDATRYSPLRLRGHAFQGGEAGVHRADIHTGLRPAQSKTGASGNKTIQEKLFRRQHVRDSPLSKSQKQEAFPPRTVEYNKTKPNKTPNNKNNKPLCCSEQTMGQTAALRGHAAHKREPATLESRSMGAGVLSWEALGI